MKITCVCGKCGEHESDDKASIEINFREGKIFFYCHKCKKMNEVELKPGPAGPYPKAKRP